MHVERLYRRHWQELKYRRIVIIGCGNVGSTVAYRLYMLGMCDILLINHNLQKAISNVLDISDTYSLSTHHISYGTYNDILPNDIIINCAGNSSMLRSLNRNDEIYNSKRIADDIINNINNIDFNGLFINVMNPCDEVTYMFRYLHLPTSHIIGTGTMLETFRLRRIVYERYNISTKSYVVGNHGDKSRIVFTDTLKDIEKCPHKLLQDVQNRVWNIYIGKGFTNFGIANVLSKLIFDILTFSETEEYCISTLCADNVYEIYDRCISVPCILTLEGIKKVIYYDNVKQELDNINWDV